MKVKNVQGEYDNNTAKKYVAEDKPIYNISSEIETVYKWEEGKPTKEVESFKLYFAQEGTEPFKVKFDKRPKLPEFLAEVKFEKLEAIEIRSKVYFRAESVQVIG